MPRISEKRRLENELVSTMEAATGSYRSWGVSCDGELPWPTNLNTINGPLTILLPEAKT